MQTPDPRHRGFALPTARRQYARSTPCEVLHILLDLSVDFGDRAIAGTCSTLLVPRRELRLVVFDAMELEIADVSLEGSAEPLGFRYDGRQLEVDLGTERLPGEELCLSVTYSARPRRGLHFTAPDDHYPDRPVQLWSQGGSEEARYWFPCVDAPNVKATTEVIATVPEIFVALSNGALVDIQPLEPTRTVYHWRQDIPHSSYLVTLVVGDFVEVPQTTDGVPISYHVPPGREAEGERAFGATVEMVRFFESCIGIPYPFARYAQVAVTDFVYGGMENSSCTTVSDETLHDERAHLDYSSEPLVAHELAHQWWGNLVTCRDWSHGWLNESFAAYFEALWIEHREGRDEFDFHLHRLFEQYSEESRRYRRPLVTNLYEDPIELFDRHLYDKGALVLHLLRSELGDEPFFAALRHYAGKHRESSVTTHDLMRCIEEATGRNVDRFFDQWVFGAGHPELEIGFLYDPGEKMGTLSIRQTQEPVDGVPEAFQLTTSVEVATRSSRRIHRIEVNARNQSFHFPLDGEPERIRFDPGDTIPKFVTLDLSPDRLAHLVRNDVTVRGRIQAIQALGRSGGLAALKALKECLEQDSFWGVRAEAALTLGRLRTRTALQALVPSLRDEHPKARRAVARALGSFRGEDVADHLQRAAKGDRSALVEAEALLSLGKSRSSRAFDILVSALERPSHCDVIRVHALTGLAELADLRAVPHLLEWSGYGSPRKARVAAVRGLGRLGRSNPAILDRLLYLLKDPMVDVQLAAAASLGELGDVSAIPSLASARDETDDGRLRRTLHEARDRILSGADRSEEVARLREEVHRLHREVLALRDRLDRRDAKKGF